jgi:hypothetical protein
MVKVTVVFEGLSELTFDSQEIDSIEEISIEGSESIYVNLKDGRKLLLPISKQDFEQRISENKDVRLEFSL